MLAMITTHHCHNQLQAQICVTDMASLDSVLFQVYKHYRIYHFNMSKLGPCLKGHTMYLSAFFKRHCTWLNSLADGYKCIMKTIHYYTVL